MAELVVERFVEAPAEVVFETISDHRRYPEFTPIRRAELEQEGEGAPNGVGAVRALHVVGPPIRERVIAYEPPHRFAYELISGQPLRNFVGEVTLPEVDGGTTFTYRIRFDPVVPGTGTVTAGAIKLAIGQFSRLIAREAERRADARA